MIGCDCNNRERLSLCICERVLRQRITCAYCCGACVCGGGHYHCPTPSCETGVCGGRGNVPSTLNIHSRCRSRVDFCCGACKLTTQNWVIPRGYIYNVESSPTTFTQRSRWKLEDCFIIDWMLRQSHARICECVSGTEENYLIILPNIAWYCNTTSKMIRRILSVLFILIHHNKSYCGKQFRKH